MNQLWQDFKAFIMRGNVLDLAVAVVVGTAFKAIVDSLVTDLINPIIGLIVGKSSFDGLKATLGSCKVTFVNGARVSTCQGVVTYGHFIGQIINFLIIAAAVFLMIKTFEKLQNLRKRDGDEEESPLASDEVVLLTEIRDLLRDRAE